MLANAYWDGVASKYRLWGLGCMGLSVGYGPATDRNDAISLIRDEVVIVTKLGFKNSVPSEGLDSRPGYRLLDTAASYGTKRQAAPRLGATESTAAPCS